MREPTDEERAYFLEHHGTESVRAMARALGLTWYTADKLLRGMGISADPPADPWTEADYGMLRRLAAEGKDCGEIGEIMGRTENAIRIKAARNGILIYQPNRKWSVEELDYLRRNWGYTGVSTIAKHVHREVDAVCQQAHKMRLGPVYGLSEDLPLSGFIEATGISRDRIIGTLVPKYSFPLISKKYGKRKYYYFVDFESILDWMERHQGLFDGSRIEDRYFVPEPDWLRRKRLSDREDNTYLPYEARKEWWTQGDIDRARHMMMSGKSYHRIAEELGRSPRAVAAKMRSVGASYTLKMYWTVDEFRYVREHWTDMTDDEMGSVLGRTGSAVASQRQGMGLFRMEDLDSEDRSYVKLHWESGDDKSLGKALGKPAGSVRAARLSMGLYREGEWSDDDTDYVLEHWESRSDPEMAEALGTTKWEVARRRLAMGLVRGCGRPSHGRVMT